MKIQKIIMQLGSPALVGVLAVSLAGMSAPTRALASSASASMTFTPSADAYVNADYPSTNYGTGITLRVDGSPIVRSFLRFAVSGLNGQPVVAAELRIYANSSSSAGITAWQVADNTWGETTITYSNMPPLGSSIATSVAVTGGTWISLDVKSYVTAEGTYSFGVSTAGPTAISMASRESGANAPQLVLTLGSSATPTDTSSVPTATATATTSLPTATATATTSSPTATPTATASSTGPIKHVFLVLMENHSYSQVWNTSSSPYITSLGNSYARATSYHAITHPSLPNYLDIYGGSNYGITTDCSPSSSCHINAQNLADNMDAKGLTWKSYEESMPAPCYLTTSGNYAPKHNPMIYFDDIRTNAARCASHDVAYSALAADLASASSMPNFAFITPNLCNDMHNCSVSTGDTWLKNNVPAILNSPACTSDKCLLVLTWDEDNGSSGNGVLTIFAGSGAKTGGVTSSVSYTHFSLLRTIEDIFGLPTQTSNEANASPMTDLLR